MHSQNVFSRMDLTPSGITIRLRELHPSNALFPISSSPSGSSISCSDMQFTKHSFAMAVTPAGTITQASVPWYFFRTVPPSARSIGPDRFTPSTGSSGRFTTPGQFRKVSVSKVVSLDNSVISCRAMQSRNALASICFTLAGIVIFFRALQFLNADSPIFSSPSDSSISCRAVQS